MKGLQKIERTKKKQRIILFLFMIGIILLAYFNLYRLITHIERVQSRIIIKELNNYEKVQSNQFNCYYTAEDDQQIDHIIGITENMIKAVDKNMKTTSKEFNMVIYPDSMEMNKGLKLPSGEETLGAYYGGNIFLLSPGQLDVENNKLENIILHEYTHLLLEEKTKGNHPIWFTEGVALYQEYIITGYEWGEGYQFPIDIPPSLEQLEKHFNQMDTFMAYRASFLRIQYLGEKYGNEALLKIMEEMGKNKSYNEALQKVLDKNKNQLENEFMLWYHS